MLHNAIVLQSQDFTTPPKPAKRYISKSGSLIDSVVWCKCLKHTHSDQLNHSVWSFITQIATVSPLSKQGHKSYCSAVFWMQYALNWKHSDQTCLCLCSYKGRMWFCLCTCDFAKFSNALQRSFWCTKEQRVIQVLEDQNSVVVSYLSVHSFANCSLWQVISNSSFIVHSCWRCTKWLHTMSWISIGISMLLQGKLLIHHQFNICEPLLQVG